MRILFQGDSVTDAGRDRSDFHDMGDGYPKYASGMISDSYPDEEFEFINLGVSGDRTENLLSRWNEDAIELQPDIISVLIGVNDVWHRHSPTDSIYHAQTSDEQFESNYRKLLAELKEKTNAKILMLSPFMLDAPIMQPIIPELKSINKIVKNLADEFADAYLPLDEIFEAALPNTPEPLYYSADGVHPNAEGACFIAEKYLEAISPLIEGILPSDKKAHK